MSWAEKNRRSVARDGLFTDYVSGPDKAIGPVCVRVYTVIFAFN